MPDKIELELFIDHTRQGTYFTLPFTVPPDIETLHLSYVYMRYAAQAEDETGAGFTARRQVNIVDLGLVAPDGTQVGASGSDKTEISVGVNHATPGYNPHPLTPGEWQILVGAYKIAPGGVAVRYTVTYTPKKRRLFKGDLHMHTLASDGVLTAEELGWRARRHGLDFIAITDHNQMVSAEALPRITGLTLIPGVEWTHYRGHASLLGADKPYDGSFAANTVEEVRQRFATARQRGATIVLDHPFEQGNEFLFEMGSLPFDCVEIWNGPMRGSNLRAVGWWHSLLAAGRKIPACGGSDYHRDTPFIFPGGPTTCIWSFSAGREDLLTALRAGCAYITFAPDGPTLEMSAGGTPVGSSLPWNQAGEIKIEVDGLLAGDVVRLVAAAETQVLATASSSGSFRCSWPVSGPGFARVEVLRSFLPGIPMLPALISNPIYFDG